MRLISGALILITVFFSIKHGWSGLTVNMKPEEAKMMTDIGVTKPLGYIIGLATLAVGVLILFPQTFFMANLLNAITILLIMSLALKAGNLKMALIEIPFLLLPLALIWLGHPLRK